MQQWDYRLGINGVKRMQAAYNTALVAQGAFSAYWTSDLRAVVGWPDAIGEDIVLTWTMLGSRGIVKYGRWPVGFHGRPRATRPPLSQRSRLGARMLEAFQDASTAEAAPRPREAGRRDRLPRPSSTSGSFSSGCRG
jgi:biofilm PGA synthesis N-glycosyltransferase PgaC